MKTHIALALVVTLLLGCSTHPPKQSLLPGADQRAQSTVVRYGEKFNYSLILKRQGGGFLYVGKPSEIGHDGTRHYLLFPYHLSQGVRVSPIGEQPVVVKQVDEFNIFLAISSDRGDTWDVHNIRPYNEEKVRQFIPSYNGTPKAPNYRCCESLKAN